MPDQERGSDPPETTHSGHKAPAPAQQQSGSDSEPVEISSETVKDVNVVRGDDRTQAVRQGN